LSVSIILFSAIFILNLAGLFSGYSLGGIYGFDEKRRRTLAIEVGMQNAGMGAVLSLKFFSSQIKNTLIEYYGREIRVQRKEEMSFLRNLSSRKREAEIQKTEVGNVVAKLALLEK